MESIFNDTWFDSLVTVCKDRFNVALGETYTEQVNTQSAVERHTYRDGELLQSNIYNSEGALLWSYYYRDSHKMSV